MKKFSLLTALATLVVAFAAPMVSNAHHDGVVVPLFTATGGSAIPVGGTISPQTLVSSIQAGNHLHCTPQAEFRPSDVYTHITNPGLNGKVLVGGWTMSGCLAGTTAKITVNIYDMTLGTNTVQATKTCTNSTQASPCTAEYVYPAGSVLRRLRAVNITEFTAPGGYTLTLISTGSAAGDCTRWGSMPLTKGICTAYVEGDFLGA